MNYRVVLSGCSGGGKSTLLAELKRLGHSVIEEPGRKIVAEERQGEGKALPWVDLAAFARRALVMARSDWNTASQLEGWVFFDRGLVDAATALAYATDENTLLPLIDGWRYHHQVFLTPPWQEIFQTDADRRHAFDDAVREYERLLIAYSRLGYEVVVLPRLSVTERVRFVLETLSPFGDTTSPVDNGKGPDEPGLPKINDRK
ncbi:MULTISPECIES: AAA family ATPase [unclassified Rhizobium]|uniref:AAA family ATPase n=1 Tax=unclassified Rhizobium TaxID=2613769 RepID=UPI001AD9951A|nr:MULTISPECIES: AAA family ATPase [unclassified Rhizobium]MBO9099235.1 AAA family ATPase [Rhizobium sp. L58/93]MBO9131959.1 AAA family ATPase [Rhizobium sp. B209b/85]MBO9169497.1 AAA family ATPase [Rhizobium sp. L245/93]MBO9185448.1 AAA family ATPase [Rhizobium sp. E27B/91]QXZ85582.1 AAA family ATPase [Rhizobium sp. K1/93]